ncbi:MAG: dockerin type I repeat-containing protein [Bacteroidales bacterium]|nr:dockerin type I repeat-containing protein [Bacteroidales bacterium]
MKRISVFLFILVVIPFTLVAQTNISGTISNNTTLTVANSPYIVTDHLNVNAGVTLTVESGVELRFNSGKYLQVFGTLTANNVTFTANESANPGFWPGIYVSYENNASFGTVTLNNSLVEYAQSLHVRKGSLTLTGNTLLQNFSSYGLDIYTLGTVAMENTTIRSCTYPVYFRDKGGNGNWTVGENVLLTGNTTDYIFIDFRDVTGEFKLPDLGLPYYYNSELQVTETGSLLVDPGVTVLGNTNAYISVRGKFKAIGTESDPIVFTNEPTSSHWTGLNFFDTAIDTACIATYCQFSDANYVYYENRNDEISRCAVEVDKSSPSFTNCTFSNNRYNLVVKGAAYPHFTGCSFGASNKVVKEAVNINIDLNATPEFSNCSIAFNNSEARGIGIIGSIVYDDSHLVNHSFTEFDSITYVLYGQVTIQDTASLVIDPGVIIKCTHYDDYIQALGSLTGIGTESKPIIFTFINDDNYGRPADTHDDGTTSISNSTSGRVILNGQAVSHMEHWKVIYGGRSSSNWAVYAYYENIVKNCEIRNSHRGILFSDNAQLINNHLEDINDYPLSRRMNAGAPVLIGNTVENVGHLGIYVNNFLDGSYSIGGLDIGSNTNVAYIIDNDMSVPVTANVTILPGTVFKFREYYGKLSVRGGFKADGSENNKIIFTSMYDNSASGNTNFNTGADPTGYKWDGIQFFETSNDDLNTLDNCEVRYVNNSVRMTSCKVVMDSVLLNFSNNYAVSIFGDANPVITNCAFNNLGSAPVYMDLFASPVFSGNTIANVAYTGIIIHGGTISGSVPARSFAGYDSITYLVFEVLRIDDQLVIPAGLVFKGNGSAYFDIYGTLHVEGTEDNPVVFTALQDDAFGNPADTEQNGQTAVGKNGNRLVFRDQSDDNSLVNHALFRYSYTYSIYNASVSPTIKNTTFYNTGTCGLYLVGTAAPTVDSCVFEDLQYPITTSIMTFPGSHRGNVLTGTTAKGIFIIDDETLTQNFTLPKRSFAGIDNIPYLFNRYNIGTSAVLTIAPGVVCKFVQNGYMNIRNGLIAEGGSNPDDVIVFTSDRDDFYGGDTYGDGDANTATNQWWRGLYFPGESIDASCLLDNCIIKNASYRYSNSAHSYNRGGVTMDNASPTIQNCLFEDNYWAILARNTSLPTITNCDFVETDPTYGYGVWNETGTVTIVAENCWWNDVTGPYHPTLNPDGLGERVSNNVDFTPWITETAKPIMGDVSLNGEVMPYDASLVLQHTVGNITLESKQADVADVSGNGEISSYDASLILQYSIGLITNFEQGGAKSGAIRNEPIVSVPESITAVAGSRVEVPLLFTTPASVKAIDMELATDYRHLKFIGLNGEALPADIMVASGYQDDSGILKISMASAYDLDLNLTELILIFEIRDPEIEASDVELVRLTANEREVGEAAFTVRIESGDEATGFPEAKGIPFLNVYSRNNLLIADLHLVSPQTGLILSVYDIAGRLTNRVVIENPDAGPHTFSFSPEVNGEWNPLKIYTVSIMGDDFVVTRKLILR